MGETTGIQWTDSTWNPVRGCSRVSEGCRNCYAEKVAARFSWPPSLPQEYGDRGGPYHGFATAKGWTGKVGLVEHHLLDPLHWRKPRRIFVNSMSDLFHEGLRDEDIMAVCGVMAACPQHTFQILTKRPERMKRFFEQRDPIGSFLAAASRRSGTRIHPPVSDDYRRQWPLPNVWLGVSTEDQATADERIPLLLQTPAAVRFISAEPLLGAVDLRGHLFYMGRERREANAPLLDWVIVGGESGPKARPCDVAWVRSIVSQCRGAGVPVFVKQLGARPYFGQKASGTSHDLALDIGPGWCFEDQGGATYQCRDRKGGDPAEWPEDLRVQEFPK